MRNFQSKGELIIAYAKERAARTLINNAQGGELNEGVNVFLYAAREWFHAKTYATKKVIRTASWDAPANAHVIFLEQRYGEPAVVWGYAK